MFGFLNFFSILFSLKTFSSKCIVLFNVLAIWVTLGLVCLCSCMWAKVSLKTKSSPKYTELSEIHELCLTFNKSRCMSASVTKITVKFYLLMNSSLFILSSLLLLGENKLYFFTVQCSLFPSSPSSVLKCWWDNIYFCFLLGYIPLKQEIWHIVQWTGICLMMTCRSNVQLIQFYTSGNSFHRINSIFL